MVWYILVDRPTYMKAPVCADAAYLSAVLPSYSDVSGYRSHF